MFKDNETEEKGSAIIKLRPFPRNVTSEQWIKLSLLCASFLTFATCFQFIHLLYLPNFSTGYNVRGQLFGDDFLNMWAASKLMLQGDVLHIFDVEKYNQNLKLLTSNPHYYTHGFSYPPHLLLFIGGLGFLTYFQALLIWSIAGLASLAFALRTMKIDLSWWLIALTSPVVVANLMIGQNGLFTGALFLGGLCLKSQTPCVCRHLVCHPDD